MTRFANVFKVRWKLIGISRQKGNIGDQGMMFTWLGRIALYCYSEITVVRGCLPFFKWEEMVVEERLKKTLCLKVSPEVRLAKRGCFRWPSWRRRPSWRRPPRWWCPAALRTSRYKSVGCRQVPVCRENKVLSVSCFGAVAQSVESPSMVRCNSTDVGSNHVRDTFIFHSLQEATA